MWDMVFNIPLPALQGRACCHCRMLDQDTEAQRGVLSVGWSRAEIHACIAHQVHH